MNTTRQSEPAPELGRLARLLQKPWHDKVEAVCFRLKTLLSRLNKPSDMPRPIRLPFGVWWIDAADYAGREIPEGRFENFEFAFVSRFLRQGMTVLDVGAHHGFYTLLASICVGPHGKVFAFEPPPRETSALLRHIRINRCENVKIAKLLG